MKTMIVVLSVAFGLVRASVLGDIAASMQVGTWAQVPQTNINQFLNDGTASSLIPYGMNGAWDSVGRKFHYLGGGHGCLNSDSRHAVYDEATNAWAYLGYVTLTNGCHGWDHISIDQKNRNLYFSPYGETVNLLRYDIKSNGPWTSLGAIPITGYKGIIRAFDWFEGSLTGAGASGALICYNSQSTNGEVLLYDPEKSQWIANIKGFGGVSTYNAFCEYSRTHNVAIFGGGNMNPNKVWRLNSDKTVTAMPDAPIGLGVHRGNVAEDPVTGNFIAWGSAKLYEYNPTGTGTWTLQTGSRVPPSVVSDPATSESGGGMLISGSITNYGVIAYISGRTSFTLYLYKHASPGTAGVGNALPGRISAACSAPSVVYDILGRVKARLDAGMAWNRAGVPAGIYIIRTPMGDQVVSQRIVVY